MFADNSNGSDILVLCSEKCLIADRYNAHLCVLVYSISLCILSYPMHVFLQEPKTPLMWASLNGHIECVKVLLDRGAQINMQNTVSAV